MKQTVSKSANFLKIVEWSEEDQCFIGSVPGWIGPCCHGDDEESVYRELCQIVDEWIRIYEEENKPLPKPTAGKRYSGKFQLRPGAGLHELLAIRALQAGRSLNSYCVEVLREVAGERPS